jgi:hypothetical protein
MKTLGLLIGILYLCNGVAAWATDTPKPGKDRFGFYITGNRNSVRLPFQLHSNLILVKVRINSSDTLNFILDTGVSHTLVTDPAALDRRKLNTTRKVKLSGAGEGNELTATVAIDNELAMGSIRASHHNIVLLDTDLLKLSEYVGVPVHGIFGYDIFNSFVVSIDFRNRELTLTSPKKYKYRPRYGDRYPIIIQNTKPYLDVLAMLPGERTVPLRVVLDTGAGHALMVDGQPSVCALPRPDKLIRAQLGRGLNGVINGSLGRIEGIRLGRHRLEQVIASFPDSSAFGMKLVNTADRQGNIGCELLRRFTVTFNYPEQYIVLKPVKKLLRERFEHDMSGMELRAKGQDFRTYFIEKVIPESPADEAGLLEGDELLFVNNENVNTLNISDIYKVLQRGEGKEVTMIVRRNGSIIVAQFALKRVI